MAWNQNYPHTASGNKTLGIMSHVSGDAPTSDVYRSVIALAQRAENAGLDEFWIAQHHFMPRAGHVASPFVFLAHLGAVAPRLALGVAVVALPFEDPIRLAEDIIATEKLLGPRLKVGLGPGNPASRFEIFGIAAEERHRVFEEKYAALTALLDPSVESDLAGGQLWPQPGPVGQRTLYQATYTPERARLIGQRGLGLLLSVTHPSAGRSGGPTTAGVGQRSIIDSYLQAMETKATPSITATRSVHVTDNVMERDAVAEIALSQLGSVMGFNDAPTFLEALGVRHPIEAVEILGYSIGPMEHVRDRLLNDPAVEAATGVIFQKIMRDEDDWLDGVIAVAGNIAVSPIAVM